MRRGAFHGRHCTQSPPFYFSPLITDGLRHRSDAAGQYEIEAADCWSTASIGVRNVRSARCRYRCGTDQAACVGSPRVGKYRIDIESVRSVAVPAILTPGDFISIDEIDTMETACETFNQAVRAVLARPSTVIGTIAERGNPFIEGIILRPDVLLIRATRENRASITDERLRSVTHSMPDGKPTGASVG